jgi:hypothetical protein
MFVRQTLNITATCARDRRGDIDTRSDCWKRNEGFGLVRFVEVAELRGLERVFDGPWDGVRAPPDMWMSNYETEGLAEVGWRQARG